MKKILSFVIIVILSSYNFIFSQDKFLEYNKNIQGTWKVDSMDMGSANIPADYMALVKQRLPAMIAAIEIKFLPNKKYFKKGINSNSEGSWDISADAKYILIREGDTAKFSKTKIIFLNEDKLIMAPVEDKAVNNKVYLYKVK